MASDMRRSTVSAHAKDGRSAGTVTATLPAKDNGKRSARRVPTAVREVESKFEIGEGFTLPELDGLPGIARVAAPQVHSLDATYFDTADLAC